MHAAAAFFLSPVERALILTMDEEGDGTSGMIAVGEGTRIRVLRKVPFPHSLAWIYTQITALIGFVPHHDEPKTQWLSLEGEPVYKNVFLDMFRNRHNHLPVLDHSYVSLTDRIESLQQVLSRCGAARGNRKPSDKLSDATLQAACRMLAWK